MSYKFYQGNFTIFLGISQLLAKEDIRFQISLFSLCFFDSTSLNWSSLNRKEKIEKMGRCAIHFSNTVHHSIRCRCNTEQCLLFQTMLLLTTLYQQHLFVAELALTALAVFRGLSVPLKYKVCGLLSRQISSITDRLDRGP